MPTLVGAACPRSADRPAEGRGLLMSPCPTASSWSAPDGKAGIGRGGQWAWWDAGGSAPWPGTIAWLGSHDRPGSDCLCSRRMPERASVVAGSEEAMTASDPAYESPRDRKRLARQAGLGRLSFISALAGVLVAYGAFALLAALVGAVAVAIGLDTELASNDWTTFGTGSAVAVTVVAFVAYLFGGYVAGRMARRAGLVNGLAVFALAVLLVMVVGAIAASQADTTTIQANLRSLGLPITATEWARIGTLVGMLVGAGIGGVVGERWHSELTRWAALGRGSPNPDQDDTERASKAQQRQPERDIDGDRPAGNR